VEESRETHLDFLDLFVVWRRDTVQESSNLSSKVRRGNEGAQDVLGQNIGVGRSIILDIIVRHVDVLQPQR
jgi:hypothetical protein